MSLNKVMLIGSVGKDPEIRSTPQGKKVASFSLATSKNWKDKNGEKQSKSQWHNIVVYNENIIKIIENYVKKGSKLYVEGEFISGKYTNKDGVEVPTFQVQIQGYDGKIELLSSKDNSSDAAQSTTKSNKPKQQNEDEDYGEDEVPF